MRKPPSSSSITPSRWFSVPAPAEAYWYFSGLALTSAMNSFMSRAGNAGFTHSTLGTSPTAAMGAKSFKGSNFASL
ncbi:hypothetical protein D3C81_2252530 [compost metagenome]